MAADGIPYTGFLYAGLMIGKDGSVKTVEFNCRLGDPETQPIMMRLKSDLLDLLDHAVAGRLNLVEASWDRRVALGVVLAAANYPGTHAPGTISGLISGYRIPRTATTAMSSMPERAKRMARSSPPAAACCASRRSADNVKQAQKRAYDLIVGIHFDGMQYRRDIGHRALSR
jgi:phosphoribosylamine--glycine ligase